MPVGQPHGLFYHDDLVWVFPSFLAVAKAFGHKQLASTTTNAGDGTVYSTGRYSVRKITKDVAQTCPTDMTRLDDVKDLVTNDKDWSIEHVNQGIRACNQCGVKKPFTREYFRYEEGRVHSTCRECRNKAVADRAAKVTKGVQERVAKGQTMFKCSGGGINAAHDAPMDQHIGDRDICRDCYNARRQDNYKRVAEPGAVSKLRDQSGGQFADSSKCGETKEVPVPKVARKKPTLHVPHARARLVIVTDTRTNQIVAKYESIAEAERELEVASLRVPMSKNDGVIRKLWHFATVEPQDAEAAVVTRETQDAFAAEFKSNKGVLAGRKRANNHRVRLTKGSEILEFESVNSAAGHIGLTEAAIRYALKKSGVVGGYTAELLD
ncbi:hypothetical protein GGF32_006497 [Allomyces javanicus]|nr:hypothetical protein GGF32_006497 [Allomyces javanicus]